MAPSPKYKIAHSKKLGRYLVAAKNITPGEVMIREEPIAVGPMMYRTDCLCFACLRSLPKIGEGKQYTCSRCNVAPLCSVACEIRTTHHTSDECQMLKENRDLLTESGIHVADILLAIRLWLIKYKNPVVWEEIDRMEAHLDKRRDTSIWKDRETNVVDVIRRLHVPAEIEPPSAELMQKLCGILDVNAFELRTPDALGSLLLLRGLYTEATLMAHDCRGNTHLTVDDNFRLTVYASVAIKENEPILFNYTSSLLGTADRKEHLREGKYFECECPLCKDPYELQSHLSSVLCPRCKKGFLGIQDTSIIDPYDRSQWQCQICKKIYGGRLIRATLNICKMLIDECADDVKSLDGLLKRLSRSLHINHFLMLSLKQKLLTACRKEIASPNPQKKIIQKMLNTCKEIYNVLDIVEPGISRLKGIMLYEMHLPMIILANRSYSAREISSAQLTCQLEEARNLLKKALTILLLEPASTPEGKLAKKALEELRTLNQNINDIKSLPPEEPKTHTRKTKEHRKKIK